MQEEMLTQEKMAKLEEKATQDDAAE